MSTVYEALKKAARERSGQPGGQLPTHAPPSRTENGLNGHAPADIPLPLADSTNRQPEVVIGDMASGRVTDEFQVLATHFQRLSAEHKSRIIEVVSASAKEGKSFVTLNLALSLARLGCRVILVGADFRAPTLHQAFNLTPLNGLLGYLLGRSSFQDCLYSTSTPGLRLVPAGGSTSSGAELFASSRMLEFIAESRAADPDGYVLLDCPALLRAPESQIISRAVDAVLMVVAANQTSRAVVGRGLELIKGCNILGLVLNRFEPSYSHR